jgi:hypothetical protein
LPDFSWYNKTGKVPKSRKIYPIATKYTNSPQSIPNGNKVDQMGIQYVNMFDCKTLKKLIHFWIFGLKICHLATMRLTHLVFLHIGGKLMRRSRFLLHVADHEKRKEGKNNWRRKRSKKTRQTKTFARNRRPVF